MKRASPTLHASLGTLYEALKRNWFLVPIVGGFLVTLIMLPQKLTATEKKVEQVSQAVSQIAHWIDNQERLHQLMKSAPPGYYWDDRSEQYLPDPEYVPPTKKGHR